MKKTLHFSIAINAPKENVWNAMLEDETYRLWASVFAEGSHFKGSWEKGASIQFVGPDGGGMASCSNKSREDGRNMLGISLAILSRKFGGSKPVYFVREFD